jgi:acyl-[acyl-carrier-protein]-phospholipid O-acyltransferase/long-chain-fatty-acid--[acyl-carrier-protein] ligase
MTENAFAAVENSPNGLAANPPELSVSKSWRRGFWSLVATQFQGAFNDNAYKNLIVFIILGTAIEKADRDRLVLVAGALFSVPFILFSMTGGFLADRYSKRSVTIGTKLFEIGVMAFAIAGLAWQNLHLEMAAIFLASTQAAFFGPSKYGLLPELLPEPRLSRATVSSNWEPSSHRSLDLSPVPSLQTLFTGAKVGRVWCSSPCLLPV